MNSSKNNKRGGYWNQPVPCTEEEVGRLMLENIKLLLQKKESDVEPNKGDDRKQQQQQHQQQQKEAQREPDSLRTRQSPRISDEELIRSGWEIDTDANPKIYSHYALPLRIETKYPTEKDIGFAKNKYELDMRASQGNILGFRLKGDERREDSRMPLSRIAQDRQSSFKKQQQQQALSRLSPVSQSQQKSASSKSSESPQRASAPPAQQDIDKNKGLINSVLGQIPNLQIQELESQIENVSFQLTELPTEQYDQAIQGIRALRETFLQ
jgi:hypothetical protein